MGETGSAISLSTHGSLTEINSIIRAHGSLPAWQERERCNIQDGAWTASGRTALRTSQRCGPGCGCSGRGPGNHAGAAPHRSSGRRRSTSLLASQGAVRPHQGVHLHHDRLVGINGEQGARRDNGVPSARGAGLSPGTGGSGRRRASAAGADAAAAGGSLGSTGCRRGCGSPNSGGAGSSTGRGRGGKWRRSGERGWRRRRKAARASRAAQHRQCHARRIAAQRTSGPARG